MDLKNNNIAIMGLAFKGSPETSDVRGSLAIDIASLLKKLKFKNIFLFDPVKDSYESPEIKDFLNEYQIISNFKDLIKNTDLAIITNNHEFFKNSLNIKLLWEINPKLKIFDFWNNFNGNEEIIIKKNYKIFGINS